MSQDISLQAPSPFIGRLLPHRTRRGWRRDGVRRLREADPGQVPAARAGARVARGVRALRRLPRAARRQVLLQRQQALLQE